MAKPAQKKLGQRQLGGTGCLSASGMNGVFRWLIRLSARGVVSVAESSGTVMTDNGGIARVGMKTKPKRGDWVALGRWQAVSLWRPWLRHWPRPMILGTRNEPGSWQPRSPPLPLADKQPVPPRIRCRRSFLCRLRHVFATLRAHERMLSPSLSPGPHPCHPAGTWRA